MFGRATIRLGIGPHSSLCLFCCCTFLLIGECVLLLCYGFSFSIPSQEIGFGNVSEMTYFVSSRT